MNTIFFLYYLFAKISLFTFGGGYAMIPLFQDELVVKHAYLTDAEFANMVALAQMTPGPVGLNAATYIGYHEAGVLGAVAGTLGVMTPCLILATLAGMFLQKMKDNRIVKGALSGIRPAVLGLIAAAVIFFANTSLFSAPFSNLWKGGGFGLCWQGLLIFAVTLALELKWKLNLLWVLLIGAFLGWGLFLF
ncbi:MAG: chromate transporter [Victivallales bacterium]|nr:chromate transporter [Victivallales bacterium]